MYTWQLSIIAGSLLISSGFLASIANSLNEIAKSKDINKEKKK